MGTIIWQWLYHMLPKVVRKIRTPLNLRGYQILMNRLQISHCLVAVGIQVR